LGTATHAVRHIANNPGRTEVAAGQSANEQLTDRSLRCFVPVFSYHFSALVN
jgi:hypothetical protein